MQVKTRFAPRRSGPGEACCAQRKKVSDLPDHLGRLLKEEPKARAQEAFRGERTPTTDRDSFLWMHRWLHFVGDLAVRQASLRPDGDRA